MKVRFNRKSGYCFLHTNTVHPSSLNGVYIRNQNSSTKYDPQRYFHVISTYNLGDLQKLLSLSREININPIFKIIGSGIYAQLRMFLGALSKLLLGLLYNSTLSTEEKQKIQDHFSLLQKYTKGDNRIVERKKPGRKGARAYGPTNKR